jgi:diguanylate cyclase (GGDEF)-like protein
MPKLDLLADSGRQTLWCRRVLYWSQGAMALSLVAILALPGIEAAMVAAGGLALMAVQHFLWAHLRNRSIDLIHRHEALLVEAESSRHRVEELFEMTDMLQSAADQEDAGAVLKATSQRLLPEYSGALYVFNNSRDRLDLASSWSPFPEFVPGEILAPDNCWALKRGKPHVNDPRSKTLCCRHHASEAATMEFPMVARGTVYGLLMIATSRGTAELKSVARVGRALADSMSLALSNIDLHEKLRAQSLRDPLTGLYNRRYMEDALEHYLSMAERGGECTSVIMVDLDNFKALNDEHGHAKGDAVLRDVASQLVGASRPADVVSRYGGEELLLILPTCSLNDAVLKAELLRTRIEALSEVQGVPVSASFGVACVPQTSGKADLIPMADAALYEAKQAGRNCVRAAEARGPRGGGGGESSGPRLVA